VLVENVPGLLIPIRERLRLTNPAGIGRVLGDLAEIGYDAEWESIPASTVGAPHDRDRVWIVAYPMPKRQRGESRQAEAQANVVGYPERRRLQGWFLECSGPQSILVAKGRRDRAGIEYGQAWESEPGVERVVDGVPDQVERINATGNAVVPQIPEWIGRRIMAIA
jgi:DNA (cytosine-5)-methyltransferase 1